MDKQRIDCLKEEIEKLDVGQLLSKLVQIPSYSFMEEQETEIAAYIADWFLRRGIDAETQYIRPGRYNAVARMRGSGGGRSLMLSGHMDTVPAYEYSEQDPFSGRIEGDRVYGRGSQDMKCGLVAAMAAIVALKNCGIRLKGDLLFGGVADEEEAGLGIKHLIRNGPLADAVITGEPTSLEIGNGQKGLEWIRCDVEGVKIHSGSMDKGVNAIVMASRLIERLTGSYAEEIKKRTHPVVGAPTINIATIKGGDQPSTVPGDCSFTFDRRFVPGETSEQVYEELRAVIEELHAQDPKFKATVHDMLEGDNELSHTPFYTPPETPVVQAAEAALRAVGVRPVQRPGSAWTDAGFVAGYSDAESIILGPAGGSGAHTALEWMSIEGTAKCALVYALLAIEYCGLAGEDD